MMNPVSDLTLLDNLVIASGLSGVFARASIVRALERSGADVTKLTRSDVRKALPELERALTIFMSPAKVKTQLEIIQKLL